MNHVHWCLYMKFNCDSFHPTRKQSQSNPHLVAPYLILNSISIDFELIQLDGIQQIRLNIYFTRAIKMNEPTMGTT